MLFDLFIAHGNQHLLDNIEDGWQNLHAIYRGLAQFFVEYLLPMQTATVFQSLILKEEK